MRCEPTADRVPPLPVTLACQPKNQSPNSMATPNGRSRNQLSDNVGTCEPGEACDESVYHRRRTTVTIKLRNKDDHIAHPDMVSKHEKHLIWAAQFSNSPWTRAKCDQPSLNLSASELELTAFCDLELSPFERPMKKYYAKSRAGHANLPKFEPTPASAPR